MPKILPNQTDIYAITNSQLSLNRSIPLIASSLMDAGVKILQYREKKLSSAKKLEECKLLRKITERSGCCFIVNDDVDIAMLVKADGIHLGQDDLPIQEARKLVGNDMIIGISTHAPEQAVAAAKNGADYIGVGPIFETKTKEDVVSPVGLSYLDWVSKNMDIPFVAIGGIKEDNINEIIKNGATCCAMVSEIMQANDIALKIKKLREKIHAN